MQPLSSDELPGRLRIHVAFHYVPERIRYLRDVLNAYASYRFEHTDVMVGTNRTEGANAVADIARGLSCAPRVKIGSTIHDRLAHPHLLTWEHREAMAQELDQYDYFMYSEDDILVPWEAVTSWQRDTVALSIHGFLRGFLRVETAIDGALMATDMRSRGRPALRTIDGRRYFHPYRPYQGFWIYTRAQMRRFITLQAWTEGRESKLRREAAAGGMNFVERPSARLRRVRYNVLIPVDVRDAPLMESFVYHLPNNYVTRNDGSGRRPVARTRVEELNRSRLWHLARGRQPR